MSYHQKGIISYLITNLVITSVYLFVMWEYYLDGRFDADDRFIFLGKAVLIMLASGIAINIVMRILVSIIAAIIAREAEPILADERDKMFELRGLQMYCYMTGAGFILTMVALALDVPPFWVLNLVVLAFSLGDVLGNVTQLYLYRRGY
ncbi:MAG: hypothetical protein COB90_10405 [Hyphomicrobiales bacterium]|nr:MAG: hypothetical protein COB90_10405 [Hyphomicrobiales bacterium]